MKAGIKGLILMVIMIFMITGCLPQLVNGGYDKFHLDAFKYNTFRLVTPKDGSLPADMTLDDYNIIAESIRADVYKH